MKRILLFIILLGGAAAVAYLRIGMPEDTPAATLTPTVQATALADDLMVIDSPLPGSTITSPLTVRGKARGNWFFEASFPVVLTDWDGRIIAETYAQAKGEWMTTDFVEFESTVTFTKPMGPGTDQPNRGFLILKKDNPSGLPEHDDAREMMVFFE
jgi:hypothetical protein